MHDQACFGAGPGQGGNCVDHLGNGYTLDFGWLKVDAFDEKGRPKHHRGVSAEPGIYFLGLPWQTRRASSFIWGVWHDAKHLADRIATKRKCLQYHASATQRPMQARHDESQQRK